MKFVDTSFWIAMHYVRDAHHHAARTLWLNQTEPLFTTNYVAGETWTFLRRRVDHSLALRFLNLVELSRRVTIVRVDEATEREAWLWLRQHDERVYSFVDATNFAVMHHLGVLETLAFDSDFSAAGFHEARP